MAFFKKITIICAIILFGATNSFAGDDNPYIVEDVVVSVSGNSPTEAHNIAAQTARRDALFILFARLSLDVEIVNQISDEDVSSMVRSEQIFDERIAGNLYSATFNITFAKDFVEHTLAQLNSPQKTQENSQIIASLEEGSISLIVPVMILQRKILLWEGSNDWRKSVNKALDGKNHFRVPVADVDNVVILNAANVNKITIDELSPLFSKYQGEEVYFLLFSQESLDGKTSVVVKGLSKNSASQVRLAFVNSEGLYGKELMDKVAYKTIEYVESLKNKEARVKTKSEKTISLEIPVKKLGDWLEVKNKIERSGFINKLDIEAISCDYVRASVSTISTDYNLVDLFAKNGFSLSEKTPDLYLLNIN